jgi:glycosyltransferase involved in cell wall biosynthesis
MYFVASAAVLLGRLLRVPVVVSEHAECFAAPMPRLILRETRLALRLADLVVPDSASLRAQMEAQGIRARFQVIHNPVDTAVFRPPAGRPDPWAPRRRLLFVGRLAPVKGITTLLRGLAHLRRRRHDFALDLVGVGDGRQEYEALARELGLEGVAVFHGGVPQPTLVRLMQTSHAFVLSSMTENCPCVLIEALASGLPIITADVGGVREVVPKDMGLFFRAGDPEALADAVDQMLDTLDAYDPQALAAYACGRFGLDVIGREFDEQYRRLVAERR